MGLQMRCRFCEKGAPRTHINARAMTFALLLLAVRGLSPSADAKVLVVGASGGTGARAIRGLLDVGFKPAQLRVLTRNPQKAALAPLRQAGVELLGADLDDSASLEGVGASCTGCYVHSTAGDTKELDTGEVVRAQKLAQALSRADSSVQHLVFNSAAAEPGHGVRRIEQKHAVEAAFNAELGRPTTHLRANLFMEELWKNYTRPPILKGAYPFSLPPTRPVYLTSVRDMGRLAGAYLIAQPPPAGGETINIASDVLTPPQMAAAFAAAQGTPCVHKQARVLRLIARLFLPDLYEVIQFYRTSTEMTNVLSLEMQYPGLLTPFAAFLEETGWGNVSATYEDLAAL